MFHCLYVIGFCCVILIFYHSLLILDYVFILGLFSKKKIENRDSRLKFFGNKFKFNQNSISKGPVKGDSVYWKILYKYRPHKSKRLDSITVVFLFFMLISISFQFFWFTFSLSNDLILLIWNKQCFWFQIIRLFFYVTQTQFIYLDHMI